MPYKDSGKGHTYIYKKGTLLKVCHAVTKWLQLSDYAWQPLPPMVRWVQWKEERASRLEAGSLSEAGSPYLEKWIAVFGKRYHFSEVCEDGKSWSVPKNGNTCCCGGGTIPKNWKILFFTVNGKGEAQMLYDTIIPVTGFLIVCLLIYREAQKW